VDALLLSRIDRYRFRVLNRPAGDRGVGGWMAATGASLVVNGSYYANDGALDTPVVSDGRRLGPASYQAAHGRSWSARTVRGWCLGRADLDLRLALNLDGGPVACQIVAGPCRWRWWRSRAEPPWFEVQGGGVGMPLRSRQAVDHTHQHVHYLK
jgi:hypothetical protein